MTKNWHHEGKSYEWLQEIMIETKTIDPNGGPGKFGFGVYIRKIWSLDVMTDDKLDTPETWFQWVENHITGKPNPNSVVVGHRDVTDLFPDLKD